MTSNNILQSSQQKTKYLVYKITNLINNMIYIGVHTCNHKNCKYMGSGKLIISAIKNSNKKNFKKEILFEFETKEEMINKEKEIVNDEFRKRKDTYNIALGGSFLSNGLVPVKDKQGKTFSVPIDHHLLISGEYKHVSTGMAVVKNKVGDIFAVSITNKDFINKEFVGVNKGYVICKDKFNKIIRIKKDDIRYKNKELLHMTTNLATVKNKLTGEIVQLPKDDPKIKNGEYVGVMKGTVMVRDKNGKCFCVDKNDPRYLSGELIQKDKGKSWWNDGEKSYRFFEEVALKLNLKKGRLK